MSDKNKEERFAEQRNIYVKLVDGTMGGGYPCEYVYYDPFSAIEYIKKLENEIQCLGGNVSKLRQR